jgi:UDPglucose--hexose-1-phosphate uridylyltransferase
VTNDFTRYYSHRRLNALTGQWVLVSPHRTLRPWQGKEETTATASAPEYDPQCYLCPGNPRAGGVRNPRYDGTYVFANDFPALTGSPEAQVAANELMTAEAVSGECRVVCYSPRHDLSLGNLTPEATAGVVRCWRQQFCELDGRPDIAYVAIFENRGELMGASNPHPHGQIWATSVVPDEAQREHARQIAYFARHGTALLADYLAAELRSGTRIVAANDHWVALVPFWAIWPFELMVLPRRAVTALDELHAGEEFALAGLLRLAIAKYDGLFGVPFPYSMGWHGRPSDGRPHGGWVLHAHFYPPLLRSASVRKFQVGFEMLGMPQRDLTPEAAAERLRAAGQAGPV